MEGLDKENDAEGDIGSFCDASPDAEQSFAEDNACDQWCEDHNEEIHTDKGESKPANDESNMLLPSRIVTIEDKQKTQGKYLKENLCDRGITISDVKGILIEQLTKSFNNNVVAASPEKQCYYYWLQNQETIQIIT